MRNGRAESENPFPLSQSYYAAGRQRVCTIGSYRSTAAPLMAGPSWPVERGDGPEDLPAQHGAREPQGVGIGEEARVAQHPLQDLPEGKRAAEFQRHANRAGQQSAGRELQRPLKTVRDLPAAGAGGDGPLGLEQLV